MTSAHPRPPVSQGKASYAISTHRREGDRDAPRAYPPLCKQLNVGITSLRPLTEGFMTAHFGKFVAYYRVSTDKQGQSGLGLDAQRQAVMTYLNGGPWKLVAEHTEVETGKRADRPELEKALAACRRHKAKLCIARLDRLSRNL